MIRVQTYIEIAKRLVPIELCTDLIDDKDAADLGTIDYLNGAIELTIDDYEFLDKRNSYDYVAWTWNLLTNILEKLLAGQDGVVSLPDQPVDLAARHVNKEYIRLSLTPASTGKTDRAVVTRKPEFMRAIVDAGLDFFERLAGIYPGGMEECERSLARLKAVRERLNMV